MHQVSEVYGFTKMIFGKYDRGKVKEHDVRRIKAAW